MREILDRSLNIFGTPIGDKLNFFSNLMHFTDFNGIPYQTPLNIISFVLKFMAC